MIRVDYKNILAHGPLLIRKMYSSYGPVNAEQRNFPGGLCMVGASRVHVANDYSYKRFKVSLYITMGAGS
jgi:hypothetical protein